MNTTTKSHDNGFPSQLSTLQQLQQNLEIYKTQLRQFERMAGGFENGNFYYLDKKKIVAYNYQVNITNIIFFKDLPKNFHKDFKKLFFDTIEHYKVLIFNTEISIKSHEGR